MKEVNVLIKKWNAITYVGLMLVTVLLSPIGVVFGAINLKNLSRKTQAYILIIVGVLFTALWLYHFFGGHHH
jgi:spore maturation protein SpmB